MIDLSWGETPMDAYRFSGRIRARSVVVAITAVLLLGFSDTAWPAKRELTLLEQELQGWLKAQTAVPRIPVALVLDRDRSQLVPSLFLRIDVSPNGEVAYVGRTVAGLSVAVDRWQLVDPRSTRIQFLGFDIEETKADFRLLVAGHVGWTGVHVHFARGSRPETEDLVAALAHVVDFGPEYDRFMAFRSDYQRLEQRIEIESRKLLDEDIGNQDQLRIAEVLATMLRDAAKNRRERALLLQIESSEELNHSATLSALRPKIQHFQEQVTGDLEAEWLLQRERLLEAEKAFRAQPLGLEDQMEAERILAQIAAAAEQNRREIGRFGLGRKEESSLRSISASLKEWRQGAERARSRGCPWEEPLTEAKIFTLLAIPAPDSTIAGEVKRCGVSFVPRNGGVARMERSGIGPATRAALLSDVASVYRLSRDAVPGFSPLLLSEQASQPGTESSSDLGEQESDPAASGAGSSQRETAVTDREQGHREEDWRERRSASSSSPAATRGPIRSLTGVRVQIFYVSAVESKAAIARDHLVSLGAYVELNEYEVAPELRWNHIFYGACNQGPATTVIDSLRGLVRVTGRRSADPCPRELILFILI
jgi:hypothetical protein